MRTSTLPFSKLTKIDWLSHEYVADVIGPVASFRTHCVSLISKIIKFNTESCLQYILTFIDLPASTNPVFEHRKWLSASHGQPTDGSDRDGTARGCLKQPAVISHVELANTCCFASPIHPCSKRTATQHQNVSLHNFLKKLIFTTQLLFYL